MRFEPWACEEVDGEWCVVGPGGQALIKDVEEPVARMVAQAVNTFAMLNAEDLDRIQESGGIAQLLSELRQLESVLVRLRAQVMLMHGRGWQASRTKEGWLWHGPKSDKLPSHALVGPDYDIPLMSGELINMLGGPERIAPAG